MASNDERILDAVLLELAEGGWGGMTVASVARRSNLTHRAVQPRHGTKGEMASAAWEQRCAPALIAALEAVLAAADESAAACLDAWQPLIRADPLTRATGEALIVRQFDPALAETVDRTLGSWLRQHCLPVNGANIDLALGQRAYLVADALGLLLAMRLPSAGWADLRPHAEDLCRAVRAGTHVDRSALPPDRAEHMDWHAFTQAPNATTGNAEHDAILDATLALVGSIGYEAATLARVARMAKVNENVIFALYRSKLEMFMDATLRQWQAGLAYNDAFAARLAEQYGPGIAEATLFREAQRPGRELVRAISLEQLRLAWHQAPLGQRFADNLHAYAVQTRQRSSHMDENVARSRTLGEFAVSQGVVLLAQLVPDAWTVPLDAMCVPMNLITHE